MKNRWIGMVVLCSMVWAFTVYAGTDEPLTVLKTGVNQVLEILRSPEFKENQQREKRDELLFQKARELFDFNAFSMGALGRNWRRFSPEQQQRFVELFSRLIGETYIARIEGESLEDLSVNYVNVDMLAPTKSGRQRADVFSEVFHGGVMTPVDYRMLKPAGGTWKIYDFKIEGVSLLGNYREQYRERFMETPEELIRELKEKVGK